MKTLIKDLKLNSKVESVKIKLKPSLTEDLNINSISLIIKTHRSLIPLCKFISIKPTEESLYLVSFYCPNDPSKTQLKDLFKNYSKRPWVKPKYAHENPMIYLELNKDNLFKIINYVYSTIN